MTKETISISGMTCGHCVGRVGAALKALPGVSVEEVTIGSATVSFDAATVEPSVIRSAIEAAGYEVLKSEQQAS